LLLFGIPAIFENLRLLSVYWRRYNFVVIWHNKHSLAQQALLKGQTSCSINIFSSTKIVTRRASRADVLRLFDLRRLFIQVRSEIIVSQSDTLGNVVKSVLFRCFVFKFEIFEPSRTCLPTANRWAICLSMREENQYGDIY
jgi:hypothetical protein